MGFVPGHYYIMDIMTQDIMLTCEPLSNKASQGLPFTFRGTILGGPISPSGILEGVSEVSRLCLTLQLMAVEGLVAVLGVSFIVLTV